MQYVLNLLLLGKTPTCVVLHFAKAKYSHRKRSSPLFAVGENSPFRGAFER